MPVHPDPGLDRPLIERLFGHGGSLHVLHYGYPEGTGAEAVVALHRRVVTTPVGQKTAPIPAPVARIRSARCPAAPLQAAPLLRGKARQICWSRAGAGTRRSPCRPGGPPGRCRRCRVAADDGQVLCVLVDECIDQADGYARHAESAYRASNAVGDVRNCLPGGIMNHSATQRVCPVYGLPSRPDSTFDAIRNAVLASGTPQ